MTYLCARPCTCSAQVWRNAAELAAALTHMTRDVYINGVGLVGQVPRCSSRPLPSPKKKWRLIGMPHGFLFYATSGTAGTGASEAVGTVSTTAFPPNGDITTYRHRRRHARCAGRGVPVLKTTASELPAQWACRRRCRDRADIQPHGVRRDRLDDGLCINGACY